MFINILTVANFTTVWFETLMRPYLSTSKVFRSNCLFVNLKPQANTADKRVLLFLTKDKAHSFFDLNSQRVCGLLKN